MLRDHLQSLFGYDLWAQERLVRTALRAEAAAQSAESPDPRILDPLVHLVVARALWRSRWQGASPTPRPTPEDVPTLQRVLDQTEEESRLAQELLANVRDEDLDAALTYTNLKGEPVTVPIGATMLQVIAHGVQHRSEVALLLTEKGFSPGDLDYLRYIFSQQRETQR
jgi:uncharacterized damage-inducible protein DinB